MVFPRTCVEITQEGERPLVAEPNVAVLYRGNQEYRRAPVDPVGDECEWFEVEPDLMRATIADLDPGADGGEIVDLPANHASAPPNIYALQRALIRRLADDGQVDPLAVEEMLLSIVAAILRPTYDQTPTPTRHQKAIADDTRRYLATNFDRTIYLAQIGGAVGCSPYHLARVFRGATGNTIHSYLTHLRLRRALTLLEEAETGIAEMAFQLGFSSHSHLTSVFTKTFGFPPSRYRAGAAPQLSTILKA